MKLIPASVVAGLLLLSPSDPATAQEVRVPPFELGGQLTGLGALGEGLHVRAMLGPRVIINLSQRNALELSGDVMGPFGGKRLDGLYFVQYKRMLYARFEGNRNTVFITTGTGGYFFTS